MKVLVWSSWYWPRVGGTETFLYHLMEGLGDREFEFEVITFQANPKLPDQEVVNGVPVHRFPIPETLAERDLKGIRGLQREISAVVERFQPELCFVNSGGPILYFVESMRKSRPLPQLLTLHSSTPFEEPANTLAGRCLQQSNRIVGVSHDVSRRIMEWNPEVADRVITIHNSVPNPPDSSSPKDDEAYRILGMGRFIPEKGFEVLIRAYFEVKQSVPSAELILVGDGPEYESLVELAESRAVKDSISFTGYLEGDALTEIIDQSSVVVMPSLWQEPFGIVALQAMQRARPVIASNVGGLPEVVKNNQTGILVEPGDVSALSDAMILLAGSEREAMGKAGKRRSWEHFCFDRFLDHYKEAFEGLIHE